MLYAVSSVPYAHVELPAALLPPLTPAPHPPGHEKVVLP